MSKNKVIFDVLADSSQYQKTMAGVEQASDKTSKAITAAFAVSAAAIGGTLAAFAKYETALIKVGKTADLQGKELKGFGKEIVSLSGQIPLSTNQLLELAASAAQLGVKGKDNIIKFTATMAKLGTATNVVGEEGAQAVARLLNITGEGVGVVDRFASVLTRLGNNTAASESEILSMATRVGQATTQFDIGTTAVLGISAALKEVGVQAEVGGSVVGRVFIEMQSAISAGGEDLEKFAQVTGMTGEQLKQTFEKDAAVAFQALVTGLGKIPTDEFNEALDSMNLKGVRFNQVLAPMAKRSDILAKSLALASEEAEKQTALNEEFNRSVVSLENQFKFMVTEVTNLAASMGKDLAPAAKGVIIEITSMIKGIREFNEATGGAVSKSIVLAAKLAALTLAFNKLKNILLLTGLFSGKLAIQMGVAAAATNTMTTSALMGVRANTGFAASFKAVALSSKSALIGIKNFQVGLGAVVGGLFIAIELGLKLGKVLGSLNELPTSEEELLKAREKMNTLLEIRLRLEEKVAKGDSGAAVRLEALNQEISQHKGLIKVLEREVKTRAAANQIGGAEGAPAMPEVGASAPDGAGNGDFESGEQEKTDILESQIEARIAAAEREAEIFGGIEKGMSAEAIRNAQERSAQLQAIDKKKLELDRINLDLGRTGIDENEKSILELKKSAAEQELALMDSKFQATQDKTAEQEAVDMESRILAKDLLNVALTEQELLFLEEKKIRDEENRAIDLETKALYSEEDLIFLQEKLITEQEAKDFVRNEELTKEAAAQNTKLKNEARFGKAIGGVQTFFQSQEVKGVQSTLGLIGQIKTKEGSAAGKAQKAFAVADAAIKIPQAMLSAFTAMVGIPFVGPVLAPIAAAAAGAVGAQNLSAIKGAKTPSYAVGTDFVGQDSMAQIHAGEAIIPARQNQFLQSGDLVLGSPDAVNDQSGSEEGGLVVNINMEGANFIGDVADNESFTDQMFNALAIGIDEGRLAGFEQKQLKVTG